jgi:hypothetical protein
LFGDEHLAEHGFRFFVNFVGGFAQFDAALETALERAFAAAAGVDLGFNDNDFFGGREEFLRYRFSGFGRIANFTGRHSYAILGEKLFGLVLVYIHQEFF